MTQIVKQKAEPINATIRSNDGNRIATAVMIMTITSLIPSFSRPREMLDMPTKPDDLGSARLSRPQAISTVLMIGRVLWILSERQAMV